MRILSRDIPPRSCWALEQAGIHPLLARLYAARGVHDAAELDESLGQLLPPAPLAGSKQAELAYQYVKNIITPDVQRQMTKAEIIVPLLRSVAEDGKWMEGLSTPPQNFMAFVNGADDAILPIMDHPADCGSFYVGIVNQAYTAALEAVIRGEKGAEEAFVEADTTIQNCLDENK